MTEAEQIDGLRRGERAAFDAVFDAHHPRLWAFLLRLTGRAEVAEELLQETFLRLARHARRLDPRSNVRGWLFTVAHNLWRSHRRWAWLDRERLAEWFAEPPAEAAGPDEVLAANLTVDELERGLADLSPTLREVAWLVIVEEYTPGEVAEILGASPEAVRQRLARARKCLRGER
jgi:RNA polymerase sigma factor (sigma-70 family)